MNRFFQVEPVNQRVVWVLFHQVCDKLNNSASFITLLCSEVWMNVVEGTVLSCQNDLDVL